MTHIYFGVDGTGPRDDGTYTENFHDSFVNIFKREFSWDHTGYRRGPAMEGLRTEELGDAAATHVQVWVRYTLAQSGVAPFVCLAGYSRGGAAVIHACNRLKEADIAVDCLLLFDAVDRAVNLSGVEVVPSNVARVYHARRHPDSASRPYFGNCGTSLAGDASTQDGGLYREEFFRGTHGAIGGVPWQPEDAPDPVSTRSVIPHPGFAALETAVRSLVHFHQVSARAQGRILESGYLPTNVTYEQDAAAARAVGAWMRRNLTVAKMSWQMHNGGGPVPPGAGRVYT